MSVYFTYYYTSCFMYSACILCLILSVLLALFCLEPQQIAHRLSVLLQSSERLYDFRTADFKRLICSITLLQRCSHFLA